MEPIIQLLNEEDVRAFVDCFFEEDEDGDAKADLCMAYVNDGSIKGFVENALNSHAFMSFWYCVEDAVRDWAYDIVNKADNAGRE